MAVSREDKLTEMAEKRNKVICQYLSTVEYLIFIVASGKNSVCAKMAHTAEEG